MPLKKDKKSKLARKNKEARTENKAPRPKRGCYFCQSKLNPTYADTATLRKFYSDRSKIVPKQRSGACSKHQRSLTKEIKYARHLSLLPFINRA